ncbi:MAG: hypothetical protein QOI35_3891 [Cryptosporangiaceae bacterium]|jgi:hypothetical protein|nr:hypothetical protein [Cryptosporangiaceae bacterium]
MGAWGDGPFDNDDAADWAAELDAAAPAERLDVIRAALAAAASADYLDADDGQRAVAAAAVVAAQRPGGPPLDTSYAPRILADGIVLDVPDELRHLAAAALDRAAGEDSELAELWDDGPDAFATRLASLRKALTPE